MASERVNGVTSSSRNAVSGTNGPDRGAKKKANASLKITKDHENPIWMNDTEEKRMNKDDNGNQKSIQFYKLFIFADFMDIILMTIGTVAAVGNGLSMPLMMVLFGDLINSYGETAGNSYVVPEVYKVVQEFVYLGMASGVASFLQVACWTITGERQAARIRTVHLETLLRQDIAFFDTETKAGEVVGGMSGDIILIQDAMGEKVGKFIQLVSSFLGGLAVAFIRGWFLTLVMISVIPLLILSSGFMSIIIGRMTSRSQRAYSEAATVVEQTISAIRTVASFTGERKAACRYSKHLEDASKASVQEGLAAGIGLGSAYSFIFFGYALGVWFGSKLIVNNGYSGGQVINVIFALFTGSFSLGQASPCISAFGSGKAAASKVFKTMKRKPQIDAYNTTVTRPRDIFGNIEFKDVSFSYPARPDKQIFNGFSLTIPSGKTTALVGKSGSGKSTVISLIERFYDPQAGEVLIDGINLKDFPLRWIRAKSGLVSQEPVLFATSIKDNIAYGKKDATLEEIKVALELASASKFIDKLPQGLDTIVGDHGTQLSGGQKQRVAIARAILKDPRILLLDEATSALDAESERIIQEALDKVMINRTTVIVAHRLMTVRNVDIITVIQQGSIVEKGSHMELLSNPDGAYSQLIHFQGTNGDVDQKAPDTQGNISVDSDHLSSQYSSFPQSIIHKSSPGNTSHSSSLVLSSVPNGQEIQGHKLQKTNTDEQPRIPFYRLASLNKPEFEIILLGVVAAVLSGVVLPIFGTYLSYIVQTFYEPTNKLLQDSTHWALMYIILGSITMITIPARSYLFAIAGAKLIERIRSMSFNKVINMEIAWFDDIQNSSGSIGAKLSADAATIRCLVGDALALIVQNIATLIAGLLVAFSACWQLALIMLALVPLIALNGWIQLKFTKGFSEHVKMMYEDASQVANDAVKNIRTVASFSAEEKVMESYKKQCEGPIRAVMRQGLTSGVGLGFSLLLVFCAYAISFYAGARLIEDKKTSATHVFRAFFALNMVAVGISQSSSLAPDATKVKSAAASVFALLDQTSAIDPNDESGITLPEVKGNIEFDKVGFTYPRRPQVKIFQDLCLAIQPGKTLALIGESGSGKSTAISLLQRFYDPNSGRILLDGFEIQKFQLRWLRQQMGLVHQEPMLFNDTIRANIAYGKEGDATEAEIIAAAKAANAHTFISGLCQGYDTLAGEQGIQLSGGQKQRVAIARAIVKEPRILLLDEATSALDNESERVVQDALDKVMVNRTTLVVAHRLSAIKGADSIAVIKNGIIVEKGKHEQLMNSRDGTYAALASMHTRACS